MSYLALYRKYRPQKFSEVIGQQHIIETLQNAITADKVAHAYLFSGPRGTGKTTVARLLAKAINCMTRQGSEPCLKCGICLSHQNNQLLDLIEIDAASHTGVDNIRELIENVRFSPVQAKYKVYIIDEAHMLSKGAFNALLKTLEEPPGHAIFVLATTEPQKLPATIISRTQHFGFKKLQILEIMARLNLLAKNEKINLSDDAARLIAAHSDGSIRDAESLLDQLLVLSDKNIDVKTIKNLIGLADFENVMNFFNLILNKDTKKLFYLINNLHEQGIDLTEFNKSLLHYMRKLLVLKINPDLTNLITQELTKEQIAKIQEQSAKFSENDLQRLAQNLIEANESIKKTSMPNLSLELVVMKFLNLT